MRKPDYGVDAPIMVRNMAIIGIVGIVLLFAWRQVGVYSVWPGGTLLLTSIFMYWGSRSGKLRLRDKMLNALPWRGDEQVLDVGCGHGLLLVGAAKRAPHGKAIGIDIWRNFDQANNRPEKALDNAKIEGVARNVEVKDGDAREIPYPDETFDVVVSSWALHNIAVGTGREKGVAEMIRVLKPGGWIGILDIEAVGEYQKVMERAHMACVKRTGPSLIFVLPTYQLVAQKPPLAVEGFAAASTPTPAEAEEEETRGAAP